MGITAIAISFRIFHFVEASYVTTFRYFVLGIVVLAGPKYASAQVKAFEGAEGFGAYASGARGNLASATLFHVTNLNDSGAGSFRDAVSQSNRFVVFDVSGIININSPIVVKSNTTIAGQTSPGGISVFGDKVSYSGASNTISRYMAYRLGRAAGREDASGASNGANMMFDHMSITWGVDETLSFNSDGKGTALDNVTVQNSIIGQGLDVVGHSAGGLMTFPANGSFSLIKNLFTDSVTRNPKVRGENEFINNVVYGWETAAYIMGDTINQESYANAIGNYFIEGPVDGGDPFRSGSASFHIYGEDNYVDTNRNGVLDGIEVSSPGGPGYPGADVVASPFAFPTSASMSAQEAVDYVIQHAGQSIIRDAVDARLIEEVASYGKLGGVIVRETDLFPGYGQNPQDPRYVNVRARLTDDDRDGMADHWELAHGLDPSDPNDWKTLTAAGYTQLEQYVNELGDNGRDLTSTGGAWTQPGTWSSGTPTLADDAFVSGNLTLDDGHGFARRLMVNGDLDVNRSTLDVFDTAAIAGNLDLNDSTATFGRLIVGAPGKNATLHLNAGSTLQTSSITPGGGNARIDWDGGTIRALGTPMIGVDANLGAGGGTIDVGNFSGVFAGQITGSGGLIKRGGGNLTLTADNTFAGGINLTGGLTLAHSHAAGTGSIFINSTGGQLLLADGVNIRNDLVTDYIFEIIDVADANATATYAGNISLASRSRQIRLQATGANATLNLTGHVNADSSFYIQKTGIVELQENAILTAGTAIVGRDGGVTRLSIRDDAAASVAGLSMGGGRGLTAGRITVQDRASLTVDGNLDLLSTNSATSNTELWLLGGTTTVDSITKTSVGSSQTSEIRFDGGVLRSGGDSANPNFLPRLDGLVGHVRQGGAIFDSAGQDITVNLQLNHDPTLATSDGGITKLGEGSLTLNAANAYQGQTTVAAGQLIVNGSTGVGLTNINAPATLSGSGTIAGDLRVAGQINPGHSSGPGSLQVNGNATFQAGSTLVIEIDGPSDHDLINVSKNLSLLEACELVLIVREDDQPGESDSFVFAQASQILGRFSSVSVIGTDWHAEIQYRDTAIEVAFSPTIPEPATSLLLLFGLPAMIGRHR